ncbi:hypothetical protein CYMTET_38679 [Cymbomonas tetramitiformis]|uniref:Uncharacterized protein n=1 Tax=Cymbomonas tetramitiformis TaxID=36881 RepID=A0AAE0CBI4_9CHLO|nr:hypothetical protein CYMTET_38679 [Cymbomonas tetramitiformis]
MATPAWALRHGRSHGSPAKSAKGERSRMMNAPPDTMRQSEANALLLTSRRVRSKRAQPLLRCTAKSRRTEELVTSVQAPQPIVYNSQTPSGASNPVYGWIGSALCGALAIFLLALVPVLQAAREALLELAALIATVREEVPDTAAAIRLPALEVTDTLEDLGTLGGVLSVEPCLEAAEE